MAPSGRPGPHDRVQLVDEAVMTCPSASVISFSTAFRRSSNSPRYLAPATMAERSRAYHPLAPQPLGHVALDDPVEPAPRRRWPSCRPPGSPIRTGVVLGPPGEDLDDPADLLVAADDRVGACPCLASWVRSLPYRFEGQEGDPRASAAGDPVAAAHLSHRREQLVASDAEQVRHGQQQVLDRHVLVAHVRAQLRPPTRGGPCCRAGQGWARTRRWSGPALGTGPPPGCSPVRTGAKAWSTPARGQQRDRRSPPVGRGSERQQVGRRHLGVAHRAREWRRWWPGLRPAEF